jgi:hypothetical protein
MRISAILVTTAATGAALVLSIGPAMAGEINGNGQQQAAPQCVTRPEYKAVKVGMAKSKVHAIFGHATFTKSGTYERYAACGGWAGMSAAPTIYYKSGIVTKKRIDITAGGRQIASGV